MEYRGAITHPVRGFKLYNTQGLIEQGCWKCLKIFKNLADGAKQTVLKHGFSQIYSMLGIKMTKFIKSLLALITVTIVVLFVISNYSSTESTYRCSGEILKFNTTPVKKELYLKISNYKWWVGLWSESDASMWIEIPTESVHSYTKIIKVGDQLQIYDYENSLRGYYSNLSNHLSISTSTDFGVFEGSCSQIK